MIPARAPVGGRRRTVLWLRSCYLPAAHVGADCLDCRRTVTWTAVTRQGRRRTKTRDLGYPVTIRCDCGKRLRDVDVIPRGRRYEEEEGVDGYDLVHWEHGAIWPGSSGPGRAHHGIKNIALDDWWRVVCPQCGRDWRGREQLLVVLVKNAKALGSSSATLQQTWPRDLAEPHSQVWY